MAAKRNQLTLADTTWGPLYAVMRVPDAGYRWEDDVLIFGEDAPTQAHDASWSEPIKSAWQQYFAANNLKDWQDSHVKAELTALAGSPELAALLQPEIQEHEHWLVESPSASSASSYRNQPLFDTPDLHRRFAALRTPKDILRFANKYGWLGVKQEWIKTPISSGGWGIGSKVTERLSTWQAHIRTMDVLIKLWDLVESEQANELQRFVRWTREPLCVGIDIGYTLDESRKLVAFKEIRQHHPDVSVIRFGGWIAQQESLRERKLLDHWGFNNFIEPVRYFILRHVVEQLSGHINPSIDTNGLGIYFSPDILLTGLYTSFGVELSGLDKPRIVCQRPGCGKYFMQEHRRQRFCSTRCQKLNWHYRQKGKSVAI